MQFQASPYYGTSQFASFGQIATSLSDVYLNGVKIMDAYQTIFMKAFNQALDEEREEAIEAISGSANRKIISPNTIESIYNRWLKHSDDKLETGLRSEQFVQALTKYTKSLVELRSFVRKAGYPTDYLDRLFDFYVRSHMLLSLIPKEYHLAPFEVAYRKGKARLLHYRAPKSTNNIRPATDVAANKVEGAADSDAGKHPLLIIYAPINTFHILDLNPRRSVIRNLLSSKGLDIYLLDWGYPDWKDDSLSLSDYLDYVIDAVEIIKSESRSEKISILGYCWGGILALIYTALFNDSIRNLALLATPVDFSKDATILANWAKKIDVDELVDEFGHMDGQVLDLAFLMRNPLRYGFDKYVRFLQRLYDGEFVETFIDVERWLYDTPPIPGKLHRQIVNDCYKNNLLVLNKMEIVTANDSNKHRVDLRKVSVPLLTIVAENDDLVSPEASISVNDYVSSKEKSVVKNPGGHVALCIGGKAHKSLWPHVAKWILAT
jgi:polyhydroxyalkanoate synthase